MRKLSLFIASTIALVAFPGLSVQALADNKFDPYCMSQYGNAMGIYELTLDTPLDHREHAVSNVTGKGSFCGSFLGHTPGDGDYTLSNHADITLPPGVEVTDSDNVPEYTYAGKAFANVLFRSLDSNNNPIHPTFLGGRTRPEQVPSDIYTVNKQQCGDQRRDVVVGDVPQGEIVNCLWGITAAGSNYNWATRVGQWPDGSPKYTLTIGPMYSEYDNPVRRTKIGLTYIDMDLCAYFGDPAPGTECGTEGQPQMKNGNASAPDCNRGAGPNGLHTIVATAWGNPPSIPPITTDPASDCVEWTSTATVDPDCDDTPYNNDFRIRRLVAAVQPGGEREYSTLNTSGVICGTAIGPYASGVGPYGWQTLTSRLDLKLAPEEIIAPIASTDPSYVPNNAYAGQISGRMAIGNASGTSISPFQAKLKVVRPPAGDCPQESRVVACFKAEVVEPNPNMSGHFYVWAMNGLDLGDWYRQTLMVGRLRNTDTPPFPGGPLIGAGLTAFDLTVCRYGGTANASACPSTPLPGISEGWLHRNGVRCSRLTAQARNWFARSTPAVETLEEGSSGGPNQLCPTKIGAIIKQSHWPDWGSNRPRTGGK